MVRNYQRKTKDRYYPETLKKAIQKVRNKELSTGEAVALYGIPRSTLFAHVCGRKTLGRGPPRAFSASFEKNMAAVFHRMERCGFALTQKEVTALVGNYATRNNLRTRFKDNLPGKDWFDSFTGRHKLTFKKKKPPNSRRADPFVVYKFYELLHNAVQLLDIDPSRIYCFNEVVINVDPKQEIVNILPYYSKTSSDEPDEQNITVLLIANACGEKITPLITTETELWNSWIYNNKTQKSSMNPRVFENFFENIVFSKLCANKEPLLIIYDGRSTHLDIHILNKAATNNVTVLKLPPNITDFLQGDIKNVIKNSLEQRLADWYLFNVEKLQHDEFSSFLTQVWDEIDPNMLSEGFKNAGIWPVDRDQFPREMFEETALTNWEKYISNEDRVLDEPFITVKNEIIDSELDVEIETLDSDNTMDINFEEIDSHNDKGDGISERTDNEEEIDYEIKPSFKKMAACHVEATKIPLKDKKKRKQRIETVEDSDPLSEPAMSRGLSNLTRALNNLCGELSSVRKEISSFKQEFVKMTSTMVDFNKRIADVENKLQSNIDR